MQRRNFLVLGSAALLAPRILRAKALSTGVVLDARFAEHLISPDHPESPARFHAVKNQLQSLLALNSFQQIPVKDNIVGWLNEIHSVEHLASIKRHSPKAYQNALLATGGLLAAVDAVCDGSVINAFCASRPPGHHATNTGQEEGFCFFNHIAIAARYAQKQHHREKILIIDWDYHHGNGTEWAFYQDPTVLFFSTHDMLAYPRTGLRDRTGAGPGKVYNINVHLPCGSGDMAIFRAFEQHLLPVAAQFKPDLILVSAGFDSRKDDPLGCHLITDEGFAALTLLVKKLAQQHCSGKVVSLLEGGYNLQGNASAAAAHLQALNANN